MPTLAPTPGADRQSAPTLGGRLAGFGACRLAPDEIPALRKRPGPVPAGWTRLGPGLLKNADEQTVAAVVAVLRAVGAMQIDPATLGDWGVIVAAQFLGRATVARSLQQFRDEGVWGTSPYLTSHCGLHSPSGTISLALNIQGPNLGVAGGQAGETQAFLTAATWLASGNVPGVWVVLTGWSPEIRPGRDEADAPPPICRAAALALVDDRDTRKPAFRVEVFPEPRPPEPFDLDGFAGHFVSSKPGDSAMYQMSDAAGLVRVAWRPGDEVHE